MEQKKVRLPREVAEAIAELDRMYPASYILLNVAKEWRKFPNQSTWKVVCDFAQTNIFELADALRYGYEIEEEPITVTITVEMQKKLREYYKCHDIHDRGTATFRRTTISHMCEIFGIKIPGVNA